MTQTTINSPSITYEELKDRLYGIGYNLKAFCAAVSTATSSVSKWKSSGVTYRYIALLEYLETVHTLNQKHRKTYTCNRVSA